jgi:hypothetical protein
MNAIEAMTAAADRPRELVVATAEDDRGNVRVTANDGPGTTFRFTVPRATPGSEPSGQV